MQDNKGGLGQLRSPGDVFLLSQAIYVGRYSFSLLTTEILVAWPSLHLSLCVILQVKVGNNLGL